jgi:glycosyltransferase involved in cell wall biosynthesis
MVRKIAFIRVYQNVPIAESVYQMLIKTFPEYKVETFTISQLLKKSPGILMFNSLITLRKNGFSILKGKNTLRKAFIGTPYLFKQVSQLISKKILPDLAEFAFSIQLQSLFDLSIPGLPNYVYTDHTHLENLMYADFDPEKLYSPEWLALEKQIYQNAAHTFTRSTNISNSLINKYDIDPEKVTCVYAGVNVKTSKKDSDDRDYTNKNILFVGIDWERKGGPDLAAAFEKVLEVHPDASLTVIGCTPKINLPNTRVYGYLSPDDLQQHYQRASLFCLPTRLEPFGVVFVEAMSYGLPILATEIGAIPHFVRTNRNGYLVAPGDINGLAARLNDMIGNPNLLKAFGLKSRQLAREHYNWENVGKKIKRTVLDDLDENIHPRNFTTGSED